MDHRVTIVWKESKYSHCNLFHSSCKDCSKFYKLEFCLFNSAPLLDSFGREQSSVSSSSHVTTQKAQEPNIDFELDVKVLINSGKCVLHTKDPSREDELKL